MCLASYKERERMYGTNVEDMRLHDYILEYECVMGGVANSGFI